MHCTVVLELHDAVMESPCFGTVKMSDPLAHRKLSVGRLMLRHGGQARATTLIGPVIGRLTATSVVILLEVETSMTGMKFCTTDPRASVVRAFR